MALDRADLSTARDGRARLLLRFVLLLVVAGLVAVAGAMLAWARSKDPSGRIIGTPASLSSGGGPITSVATLLDEPAKGNLVGRGVQLSHAAVQQVVGDHVFLIGPTADRTVPVVLLGELAERQPEGMVQIREGQRVWILGEVWRTPERGALGALGMEGLARSQGGIFIMAEKAAVLGR
jgi:hypothetical protein